MANDKALRQHFVSLLKGGDAHATYDAAVKDFPANLYGKKPKGAAHSPWEVLEHLRIAQWDMLEFSRNPGHVSPEWPSGYWPNSPEPENTAAWNHSVKAFQSDLEAVRELVAHTGSDLFTPFAHGE